LAVPGVAAAQIDEMALRLHAADVGAAGDDREVIDHRTPVALDGGQAIGGRHRRGGEAPGAALAAADRDKGQVADLQREGAGRVICRRTGGGSGGGDRRAVEAAAPLCRVEAGS
jgi:hypothetical protein